MYSRTTLHIFLNIASLQLQKSLSPLFAWRSIELCDNWCWPRDKMRETFCAEFVASDWKACDYNIVYVMNSDRLNYPVDWKIRLKTIKWLTQSAIVITKLNPYSRYGLWPKTHLPIDLQSKSLKNLKASFFKEWSQ